MTRDRTSFRATMCCVVSLLAAMARPASAGSPLELQFRGAAAAGAHGRNLVVADFDGDDLVETVATVNTGWIAYSHMLDGYQPKRVGPPYFGEAVAGVGALASADVIGDCRPELVVADNMDHELEIWDLRESEPLWTIPIGGQEILAVEVGDFDGDLALEVAVLTKDFASVEELQLLDVVTGDLEATIVQTDPTDLCVGNLDADSTLEIVVVRSDASAVAYDGATLAVDWSVPIGDGGDRCATGDFDEDGADEIAVLWRGDQLTVFDPGDVDDGIFWQLSFGITDVEVFALDLDGLAPMELVTTATWKVNIRSASTGAVVGSFDVLPAHVEAVASGDLDDDGDLEIAWSAERESRQCRTHHFAIHDATTLSSVWTDRSWLLDRFVAGKNLDGSGSRDLLVGWECTTETGQPMTVQVLDANTFVEHESVNLPSAASALERLDGLDAGPFDGDSQLEILAAMSSDSVRRVVCIDSQTAVSQWNVSVPEAPADLRALNIAGDATREAVLALPAAHRVRALQGSDGTLLWTSGAIGAFTFSPIVVAAGNVDADAATEVVAAGGDGIGIFTGATGVVERAVGLGGVLGLTLLDADGDADLDIVVAGESGMLRVVNPKTGGVGADLGLFTGDDDLKGIVGAVGLRTPTARDVLVYSSVGALHLVDLNGPTIVWSADFPSDVALLGLPLLAIADLEGDGDLDIVAQRLDRIDVIGFPTGLLFADGFESANASRWTSVGPAPACL